MSVVEAAYLQALDAQSGAERVGRASSLYAAIHEMLTLQVLSAHPDLTDQQVRLRVARVLYLSDPRVQRLLDRLERQRG